MSEIMTDETIAATAEELDELECDLRRWGPARHEDAALVIADLRAEIATLRADNERLRAAIEDMFAPGPAHPSERGTEINRRWKNLRAALTKE